ncbi:unnamed protein product [Musa banksii]
MVVGTVYCDTCFHPENCRSPPISSQSVRRRCEQAPATGRWRRRTSGGVFRDPAATEDKQATPPDPSLLGKTDDEEPRPFCAVASSATTAGLRLKSWSHGVHVYSAGFFKFKPLDQPELCHRNRRSEIGR